MENARCSDKWENVVNRRKKKSSQILKFREIVIFLKNKAKNDDQKYSYSKLELNFKIILPRSPKEPGFPGEMTTLKSGGGESTVR